MVLNLKELISSVQLLDRAIESRIHPLRSMSYDHLKCYVKREDELGFGISGTKLRKYLSLLPPLLERRTEEAIVIGSPSSSHVLSLSQILIENGITPLFFLLGNSDTLLQGNFLLSSLFIEKVRWFPKSSWESIDAIAETYAREQKSCVAIPKGACCKEALPGALTLALDILRNEEELGICF